MFFRLGMNRNAVPFDDRLAAQAFLLSDNISIKRESLSGSVNTEFGDVVIPNIFEHTYHSFTSPRSRLEEVFDAFDPQEEPCMTAADGSFRLGPFPPGPYFVELHLDGEPTLHLRPAIEVVAGETRDLGVLRFGAGGRIRARVLDLSGAVLSPDWVDVLSLDGSISYAGERDDGAFLSEELAPGAYLVRAKCLIEEVRVETGAVAAIDLRMRPGGTLRLVAVLADGSPGSAICSVEDAKGRLLGSYGSNGTPYLAAGDYRVVAADSRGRRADAPVRMGHEDQTVILVLE